jgi:hypothetical protein
MATYDDLVADLTNYMEDVSAEFVAAIPSMIRMAEARIYREVNINEFDHRVSGTLAPGESSIPIPVDLIQPRNLTITLPAGRLKTLQMKQLEYLLVYNRDGVEGIPNYYAIETPTQYFIAPSADVSYPYVLAYRRRQPALGPTNQQNFLTDVAYDLLLSACMVEAGKFVLDDRKNTIIAIWEDSYQKAVSSLTGVDLRSERDDFRVPTRSTDNR